jgi:vitamin B12 transporter
MHLPHHRKATLSLAILVALALLPSYAQAVIVRGKVLTPFSLPLGNVRVELVQGHQIVAFGISQMDGSYEIRSSAAGHFLLLTTALPYTPNISEDFYGGTTGVVTRNVVMQYTTVNSQLVVTSSGLPTPIQQIPAAVNLTPQVALTTQINIVNDLRQSLGTFLVQTGQAGGPATLYIRGGSPDANKVLTDGVPSTNIGGYFDLSPVSTIALTGPELYRGPNSALQGTGAEAGILNLSTTHGTHPSPVLNYTGDAGNFYTYRNEGIVSGVYGRLDFLAGFSRFNTSNALPLDQYHTINSIANIGFAIFTNTLARFTLRNTTSAVGLPSAHDIYGISSSGKQANQDIYSGLAIENTLGGNWHNLARYGISRQREQLQQFTPTGQPVTTIVDGVPQTTYYGNVVTLRGGNGYSATGQAAFILPAYDSVSNRDELYYQSDYRFPWRIAALFSFHYENERGRLLNPATQQNQIIKRTNYLYTLQIQGDIQQRLFYSFGGAIINNHIFGITGTPRLGLTYDAVRPSAQPFHGTVLHANLATGVQEPSLVAQLTSLYTLLQQTGNATYNVPPITSERSRTWSVGIDQNILNQKLILKAKYFHNQFDHQLEFIGARGLEFYFDIPATIANQLPPASLNSLTYLARGIEAELDYQALSHLFLRGGYTYLDSVVQQSFSNVTPATNPNLPGIPIGALSPLVGSRPFRRPPNVGFFSAQYTVEKFSAAVKGAVSSGSDDSTFQLNNDRNGGNTLLLPNRNLDFGYFKLDINATYTANKYITIFTQLDNLLSQQHIGPIGYPGLPFTFRAGMKIRIGGN